jgi:hypothetical protein
VLSIAVPPNQHLYCGGEEVSGLPHTERRNQIVDCRVRIEPEGSYGSFGFAAHTIVEATEDEDSETKFDIGEYSVDYVSSSLRGVSAEDLVDSSLLDETVQHADLFNPANEDTIGISKICRYLRSSCGNIDRVLDTTNTIGNPVVCADTSNSGVTNPLVPFLSVAVRGDLCSESVEHCLEEVYLPELRNQLLGCVPKRGVFVSEDHFIITGGTGGGYGHVTPASRYYFTSRVYNDQVDSFQTEVQFIESPVMSGSTIVPFVMLNIPDGETVQQATLELTQDRGTARDILLSRTQVIGGTQGFDRAIYKADALEELPAGRYDAVLRVRDSDGVMSFDGAQLVVLRPLPYPAIDLWFTDYLILPQPEGATPQFEYFPTDIFMRITDESPLYSSAAVSFKADNRLSNAFTATSDVDLGSLSIQTYEGYGIEHAAIDEIISRYRGAFLPYPGGLFSGDDLEAAIIENRHLLNELSRDLGIGRGAPERSYDVRNGLDSWSKATFGVSLYGNRFFLATFGMRYVVFPEAVEEFLEVLENRYKSGIDPKRHLYLAPITEGVHSFDEGILIIVKIVFDPEDVEDSYHLNPIMFDKGILDSLDSECQIGEASNSCEDSFCVPILTYEFDGFFVEPRLSDKGICLGSARRGMYVYDQAACESGLTEQIPTPDNPQRCI